MELIIVPILPKCYENEMRLSLIKYLEQCLVQPEP